MLDLTSAIPGHQRLQVSQFNINISSALAQKVTAETAEPVKAGITKVFKKVA